MAARIVPAGTVAPWSTAPICRRTLSFRSPARSRSPYSTRPESGVSNPSSIRSSVDLPAPDGPVTATNSPGRASMLTSSRIVGPFVS